MMLKQTFAFFILLFGISGLFQNASAGKGTGKISTPEIQKSLLFTENKNQWPEQVKFRADLHNGKLYLQPTGFLFQFYDGSGFEHHSEKNASKTPDKVKAHAYSVTFLGANPKPEFATTESTPEIRNYYLGNDPAKWASEVKSYRKVTYKNIYPKTELQIFEKEEHLKYEFILEAGADPSKIKLQYKGAEKVFLKEGELHIKTSVAEVRELKPYAYQIKNGKEVEVPCRFVLNDNILTFDLSKNYDKKLPLVIDPTLVYSSYSGSTSDNWGFTATYDQDGNMYSGGMVQTIGFPTTIGAYDMSFNGSPSVSNYNTVDIGILKFNTSVSGAQSLVYATYIGGDETEVPHSLIVNNNNELIILGTTSSFNYPTTAGSYDRNFNFGFGVSANSIIYTNGSDIVISKLNSSGSNLLASTFLGGSDNDGVLNSDHSDLVRNYGDQFRGDISVDSDNNIYIASSTQSRNFPVLTNFQYSYRGGDSDGVISKFNPNLTTLLWSTYIGGSANDAAYSIQVDDNHVFVSGGTSSSNMANTSGSFKSNYGGATDGYVAKFTKTGSHVKTSYIGTSSYDQTFFVQLDASSNVYVLGQSLGSYPVSNAAYFNQNSKQFIQKLTPDLSQSIFSTVFGSTDGFMNISPTAFLVDDCEKMLVAGWGGSTFLSSDYNNQLSLSTTGLPVTTNAFQRSTDGSDFYLMQLNTNAANLEYATFFGGSPTREHVDGGTSRFDKRGIVYQAVCAGCGGSSAFPTTPGAWSRFNSSSNCNNAAFKFDFEISKANPGADQSVCANAAPFILPGFSPAGGTWTGNGVAPNGLFTPHDSLIGVQQLTYTFIDGACVSSGTINLTVNPAPAPDFTGLDSSYCTTGSARLVTLTGIPAGGTFSGPGIVNDSIFDFKLAGVGKHTITYTYTSADSCTKSVEKSTFVGVPEININLIQPGCAVDENSFIQGLAPFTIRFDNFTENAISYFWDFGDGTTSSEASPTHTYSEPGTYNVYVSVEFGNNCVQVKDFGVFEVKTLQLPNIFTPNHDGKNEYFKVNLSCPPLKLVVFNRWGKKVFEDDDYKNNWNGDNLTDGVYYYQFTNKNGQSWKGWFEVIR